MAEGGQQIKLGLLIFLVWSLCVLISAELDLIVGVCVHLLLEFEAATVSKEDVDITAQLILRTTPTPTAPSGLKVTLKAIFCAILSNDRGGKLNLYASLLPASPSERPRNLQR